MSGVKKKKKNHRKFGKSEHMRADCTRIESKTKRNGYGYGNRIEWNRIEWHVMISFN